MAFSISAWRRWSASRSRVSPSDIGGLGVVHHVEVNQPVGYAEHLAGDARRGQRRPHWLGQQDFLQPVVGLVALPEQAHPLTVRELLDLLVGLHVWEAKHRQDEWVVSGRQLVHNVIVQIQSGEPGFVDGR